MEPPLPYPQFWALVQSNCEEETGEINATFKYGFQTSNEEAVLGNAELADMNPAAVQHLNDKCREPQVNNALSRSGRFHLVSVAP
ncbi:MyosinI binding protein [Echinococcus multilocularis]|uniref:MyosinI binding protein n=1 Tax=Echinococcus multilocularis TaxID=6211 RepID=A0A0S4MIT7_ECHMU|nr:MyosinI binding protein [Echinococcus multilocularis]